MIEVIKTNSYGNHTLIFCDKGHTLYLKYGIWQIENSRGKFYLRKAIQDKKLKKNYRLHFHREILGLLSHDSRSVDHINGNSLDNRIENLRICTHHLNMQNIRKNKTNDSSRYKGVIYNKTNKNWRARITFNYKRIDLGSFKDEYSAAIAYNNAAQKYYGEFANLNVL